jgi:hypothetical protein
MLTHEGILEKFGLLIIAANGDIVQVDRNGQLVRTLFAASDITAEFGNLFCGAPIMYKTICELIAAMEIIIQMYHTNPNPIMKDFAKPFIAFRSSLIMTQKAVEVSMSDVAVELRKAAIGNINN